MGYETNGHMHGMNIFTLKNNYLIMASPKRKLSSRKSFGKLNIFLFASEFLL
jgi:hypothetical protein